MKLSSVFPGIRKRRSNLDGKASELAVPPPVTHRHSQDLDFLDGKLTSIASEERSLSDDESVRIKQGRSTPELDNRRAIFKASSGKLARSFDGSLNAGKTAQLQTSDGFKTLSRTLSNTGNNTNENPTSNARSSQSLPRGYSSKAESLPVLNLRHFSSSSASPSPNQGFEFFESQMVNQEDIVTLTHHVRNFSAALNSLRSTFSESEGLGERPDETRAKAHELLGEVLSILKGVLKLYPPLNSVEILSAAGTVIQKIKGHNYNENEEPEDFYQSTDQLAWAFSSSVSDFLMGDQDGGSTPIDFQIGHARSFENFTNENGEYTGYDPGDEDQDGYHSDHAGSEASVEKCFEEGKRLSTTLDDQDVDSAAKALDQSAMKAKELDKVLLSMESGIDLSLQRTKIWSKYAKDVLNYMEKRTHLEVDYCKALTKLAQTTKTSISEEGYLPLQSSLITSLDYDLEYANNCQNIYQQLVSRRIIEPLQARRTEHDRKRSKLKDMWNKECKKLQDCRINLKKAKSMYIQKQQELDKLNKQLEAKEGKDESSTSTSGFSIGKKKKEEDVVKKAEESEEYYKQCVNEANKREQELERMRARVLLELRQLVYQCDMTMKAVTVAYFQMMQSLAAPLPYHFQTLADGGKDYEVGTRFAEYTRLQKSSSKPARVQRHTFEHYRSGDRDDRSHNRTNSGLADLSLGSSPPPETGDVSFKEPNFRKDRRTSVGSVGSDISNHRPPSPSGGGKQPKNAWQQRGSASDDTDRDSLTSRSLPPSPTASPGVTRRSKDLSLLQPEPASDDETLDKDVALKKFSPGPFRNYNLSGAATTHSFRKLRSPSRCKECDSYVYFNGAECEQCSITCHKKCLETLAIKCGHKPLPRKMTTFGVDFQKHLQATKRKDIPILIEKCIDEIDFRGLEFKGLYRVSGVKSRVERLCQQFETGADLVDLSTTPPQVVSSVLKLYLRQLPEPLLTFDLYQDFIQIAKDSMACKFDRSEEDVNEENDAKCEEILSRLHKVVKNLPYANLCTVEKLLRHLRRVSRHSDRNSMTVSSLAIVFGPTLLRPRGRPDSLSALMDMPHQTRVVELLIMHSQIVDEDTFDELENVKSSAAEASKSASDHGNGDSAKGKRALSVDDVIPETSIAGQFKEEVLAAWNQGETVAKNDQQGKTPGKDTEASTSDTVAEKDSMATISKVRDDDKVQKEVKGSKSGTESSATMDSHVSAEKPPVGETPGRNDISGVEVTVEASVAPSGQTPSMRVDKQEAPVWVTASPPSTPKDLQGTKEPLSPKETPGTKEPLSSKETPGTKEPLSPKEIPGTKEPLSPKETPDTKEELVAKDVSNAKEASATRKQAIFYAPTLNTLDQPTTEESPTTGKQVSKESVKKKVILKDKEDDLGQEIRKPRHASDSAIMTTTGQGGERETRVESAALKAITSREDKEEDLLTFMSKLKMSISLSDDDVQVTAISRENSEVIYENSPISPTVGKSFYRRETSDSPLVSFDSDNSVANPSDKEEPQVIPRSKTCPDTMLRRDRDAPRVPPKPSRPQGSPPRRDIMGRSPSPEEENLKRSSSREAMAFGNTRKLVERFTYEPLREGKELTMKRRESSDSDEKVETVVSVKDMKKQFELSATDKELENASERISATNGNKSSDLTASVGTDAKLVEDDIPPERSSPRLIHQRNSRERLIKVESNGKDRKPEFV